MSDLKLYLFCTIMFHGMFHGGLCSAADAPELVDLVPFRTLEVFRVMAIHTQEFQIVEIKQHTRIRDVVGVDVFLMMYDPTRPNNSF